MLRRLLFHLFAICGFGSGLATMLISGSYSLTSAVPKEAVFTMVAVWISLGVVCIVVDAKTQDNGGYNLPRKKRAQAFVVGLVVGTVVGVPYPFLVVDYDCFLFPLLIFGVIGYYIYAMWSAHSQGLMS